MALSFAVVSAVSVFADKREHGHAVGEEAVRHELDADVFTERSRRSERHGGVALVGIPVNEVGFGTYSKGGIVVVPHEGVFYCGSFHGAAL